MRKLHRVSWRLLIAAMPFGAADACAESEGLPANDSPLYRSDSLVTGDVSLAFGYAKGAGRSTFEGGALVGGGVVHLPLWAGWNADAEIAEIVGTARTDYGGFGHVYLRTPKYALGFVVGATEANGSAYDGAAVTVGLETAAFFPEATVSVQILRSWGQGNAKDSWSLGGEARFYLDPNTKVSGRLAYQSGNPAWLFGVAGEHRLPGSRFSFFATTSYCSCLTWSAVAGARLIFGPGGGTLQDYDQLVPFTVGRPLVD